MNSNLSKIEKFSEEDFINFLYAERDRVKSREANAGWTFWALMGSLFALCCFIYNTLKSYNDVLDFRLCYYIFSVFFLIFVYFTFQIEEHRALWRGDKSHVARVGDSKIKHLLFYIWVVSGLMIGLGCLWDIDCIVVLWWGVLFTVVTMSWVILFFHRENYITTNDLFVLSNRTWLNILFQSLICGAFAVPATLSVKKLQFGFSVEFECTIAVVIMLIIVYSLTRSKFAENYGSKMDDLIDRYLFKDRNRQRTMRDLEVIFIGSRPVYEMMDMYDALVEKITEMPKIKERVQEVVKATEGGICPLCSKEYLAEIDYATKFARSYSKLVKNFTNRSQELLSVGESLQDDEFVAMLKDIIQDGKLVLEIDDMDRMLSDIDRALNSINDSIQNCELCKEVCVQNKWYKRFFRFFR